MIGSGVFIVFAPAAQVAGAWLLLGLVLAAAVAYANAMSSAQLAAVHPQSGGAYVYGRTRLSAATGAFAGYAFVAGKTASCSVAALAVGAYVWPSQQRAVAASAVIAVTAVNLAGITKTARVTRWLVLAVLAVLAVVVVIGLAGEPAGAGVLAALGTTPPDSGVLAAGALLFFAFAGYARIATLGEEVRDPAHTIPRAIPIALLLTLVVYAAVAIAALHVLGVGRLTAATAPLADVAETAGASWLVPIVRAGGAVAALGVLITLVAAVGRTVFAMAANHDLPAVLGAVHLTRRVPHHAQIAVAAAALAIVAVGGLVGAVAFSAFTTLLYYLVANAAALRLKPSERLMPRLLAVAGLLGCLALAASLPWRTMVAATLLLALCLILRAALRPRTS